MKPLPVKPSLPRPPKPIGRPVKPILVTRPLPIPRPDLPYNLPPLPTENDGVIKRPIRPWWCSRPACGWWQDYCQPVCVKPALPVGIPIALPAQPLVPVPTGAIDLAVQPIYQPTPVTLTVISTPQNTAAEKWFLGLSGMVLPGKGLGVESVDEDSPADAAGLESGMMITHCNETKLVDQQVLADAIAESDGTLSLTVIQSSDAEPIEMLVEMTKLAQVSF